MINTLLALCARAEGHSRQHALLVQQARAVTQWGPLLKEAERQRVAPLLYHHLNALDLPLPLEERITLQGLYLRYRRAHRIRASALGEILYAYQSAGIGVLVLKGAALSHVVYPDPALRPMCDLDLLVKSSHAQQAQFVLTELGFDIPEKISSHLSDNHYHLKIATRHTDGMQVSVEIHHQLFHRYGRHFPALAFEDLIDTAIPFQVEDVTAYTLGYEDMLWHLYRHSFGVPQIFEPFRLIYVADMVSLVEKYLDRIDWHKIALQYPQVLNILPLFHSLTPWSEECVERLKLQTNKAPPGVGRQFDGWPLKKVAIQLRQGKSLGQICFDTFFPSQWWLSLFYGVEGKAARLWCRFIRHPLFIVGWLKRYCLERFGEKI